MDTGRTQTDPVEDFDADRNSGDWSLMNKRRNSAPILTYDPNRSGSYQGVSNTDGFAYSDPPPPPPVDPDPWGDWVDAQTPNNTRNTVVGTWVDALPPNNTRNRVVGSWRRTGRVRENPVTLTVEERTESHHNLGGETDPHDNLGEETVNARRQSGNRSETQVGSGF